MTERAGPARPLALEHVPGPKRKMSQRASRSRASKLLTTRRYAMHAPEQFLENDAERVARMGFGDAAPRLERVERRV